MANADTPFGLKYLYSLAGGRAQTHRYYIPSTDSTAVYVNDPVVLAGSADTKGVAATVTRATVGNGYYITGVVAGFQVADGANTPNLNIIYRPASTAMYVEVYDDPWAIFLIQDDGVAALTADDVGFNAVLIATHSGSTSTGLSGIEMNTSTDAPAADASNQLLIRNLYDSPDNALGVNAKWEVMINLHTYRSTGDGDGSLGV